MKFLFIFTTLLATTVMAKAYNYKVRPHYENSIHNGTRLTERSKSWQSVVKIRLTNGNYMTSCTGTFVSKTKILTAAHCLQGSRELYSIQFYRGSSSFHTEYFSSGEYNLRTNYRYNSTNDYDKDYGVITLRRNILPSYEHKPMATLSQKYINSFHSLSGKRVYTVGTSEKTMNTIAFSTGIVTSYQGYLTVKSISSNQGICKGDSGGPITLDTGSELVLIGITSAIANSHLINGSCASTTYNTVMSSEVYQFIFSSAI